MRVSSSFLWPASNPAPNAAAQLDALHKMPSGFAPRPAKQCEQAFWREARANPSDALTQAGLLQILRERAVHHAAFWPHQKRHKQALKHKALTQLGVLLKTPDAPGLADVLNHADDLWEACTTPASETLLREEILGALGDVLMQPHRCEADISAALKAFDRLSVLQPWALPTVVTQLKAYAGRATFTPAHIALVPPILQRALAAPLGLGPTVVHICERLCQAYPTDLGVLMACCQMLKGVLLTATPPSDLGQSAIAQMLALATAVPGEQPSYEAARLLLRAAQQYDSERAPHGAALAVLALDAVQGIIKAGGRREGDALVRSMAERTWLQLEQNGQTPVAQAATAHLASGNHGQRRITAPRVS